MKQLHGALKLDQQESSRSMHGQSRVRSFGSNEKWCLDPDFIEDGPLGSKTRFANIVKETLPKKFQSEKILQEDTFRDILIEFNAYLTQIPSELQRLAQIEQTLHTLGEDNIGEFKNYIKQFQSLLDARIRKLKKRENRAELLEFERIAGTQATTKRKKGAEFINEDEIPNLKKKNSRKEDKNLMSSGRKNLKNSGLSNQNESGQGKNKSGSESKSGQANALTALLATTNNVGRVPTAQDKKGDQFRQSLRDSFDCNSIFSASIAVRSRSPKYQQPQSAKIKEEKAKPNETKAKAKAVDPDDDKDDGFIFHHPKKAGKKKP